MSEDGTSSRKPHEGILKAYENLDFLHSRDARALRGVDLIHRLLHLGVRRDVRHERVQDLIPEFRH